jgi:hypothetical protein
VRPLSAQAADILRDARRRSPTVVRLLREIERTDLIVLVDVVGDDPTLRARTAIIGATDEFRFLHIALNAMKGADRLVELLGHELQHAVEIGAQPDLRDGYALAESFAALGWSLSGGHFETEDASTVEDQIRQELHAWAELRRRGPVR